MIRSPGCALAMFVPTRVPAEACACEVRGSDTPALAYAQPVRPEQSNEFGPVAPYTYGEPSLLSAAAMAAAAREPAGTLASGGVLCAGVEAAGVEAAGVEALSGLRVVSREARSASAFAWAFAASALALAS